MPSTKCSTEKPKLIPKGKDCKLTPPPPPSPDSNKPKIRAYAPNVIEVPNFLRMLGPKHLKIAICYLPSLITYTLATAIVTVYIADWKALLRYVPFYRGKYDDLEPINKQIDAVNDNNVNDDDVGEGGEPSSSKQDDDESNAEIIDKKDKC